MSQEILLSLGTVALINILSWLTPGPNMLAVISASISNGRRAGIMTGLGLNMGDFVWACAAVMGVVTLFELFPHWVLAFRFLGAAYLLWLGLKALNSAVSGGRMSLTVEASPHQGRGAFRTGFIVMATNLKAALFFGSILTAFVPANALVWLSAAIVAICVTVGLVGHTITATVFSSRLVVEKFQSAPRSINACFGALFTALGLGVAWDACRRIGP
jgi:threonine/homoserine/homoserine lactone efflux protein